MSDDLDLDLKFALDPSQVNKDRYKIPIIHCQNHKSEKAVYDCPICGEFYCKKCIKILVENKEGQQKVICKKCIWKFRIKSIIFIGTFIFLILVSFLNQ